MAETVEMQRNLFSDDVHVELKDSQGEELMGRETADVFLCDRSQELVIRQNKKGVIKELLCLGKDDEDWFVVYRRGAWATKACWNSVVVAGAITNGDVFAPGFEYWFYAARVHEADWPYHIGKKVWGNPHRYADFIDCLDWTKRLIREPGTEKRARTR